MTRDDATGFGRAALGCAGMLLAAVATIVPLWLIFD